MTEFLKRKRVLILSFLSVFEILSGVLLFLMAGSRRLSFNKHLAFPEYLAGAMLVCTGTYILFRVLFKDSSD